MSNPLIEKYNQLRKEREKPKDTKVGYELKPEFLEQLALESNLTTPSAATSNTGITKASILKTYDKDSGNDAFLQIAEKVKNGTAQVTSVSLQVDAHGLFSYGKRISFEVYDYEP